MEEAGVPGVVAEAWFGIHAPRTTRPAVAARQQGTNPDKVLPQVRVVGNAFISLMAYQAKG